MKDLFNNVKNAELYLQKAQEGHRKLMEFEKRMANNRDNHVPRQKRNIDEEEMKMNISLEINLQAERDREIKDQQERLLNPANRSDK